MGIGRDQGLDGRSQVGLSEAVRYVVQRERAEPDIMVLSVVSGEECSQCVRACYRCAEALAKIRPVPRRLAQRRENGLSLETCGRECRVHWLNHIGREGEGRILHDVCEFRTASTTSPNRVPRRTVSDRGLSDSAGETHYGCAEPCITRRSASLSMTGTRRSSRMTRVDGRGSWRALRCPTRRCPTRTALPR